MKSDLLVRLDLFTKFLRAYLLKNKEMEMITLKQKEKFIEVQPIITLQIKLGFSKIQINSKTSHFSLLISIGNISLQVKDRPSRSDLSQQRHRFN